MSRELEGLPETKSWVQSVTPSSAFVLYLQCFHWLMFWLSVDLFSIALHCWVSSWAILITNLYNIVLNAHIHMHVPQFWILIVPLGHYFMLKCESPWPNTNPVKGTTGAIGIASVPSWWTSAIVQLVKHLGTIENFLYQCCCDKHLGTFYTILWFWTTLMVYKRKSLSFALLLQ